MNTLEHFIKHGKCPPGTTDFQVFFIENFAADILRDIVDYIISQHTKESGEQIEGEWA